MEQIEDSILLGELKRKTLTHTLTHNRKAAGGLSRLRINRNRHFPSHEAPTGSEITPFSLP